MPKKCSVGGQLFSGVTADNHVPHRESAGGRQPPTISGSYDQPPRPSADGRSRSPRKSQPKQGSAVGQVGELPGPLPGSQPPGWRPALPQCHEAMVARAFN